MTAFADIPVGIHCNPNTDLHMSVPHLQPQAHDQSVMKKKVANTATKPHTTKAKAECNQTTLNEHLFGYFIGTWRPALQSSASVSKAVIGTLPTTPYKLACTTAVALSAEA